MNCSSGEQGAGLCGTDFPSPAALRSAWSSYYSSRPLNCGTPSWSDDPGYWYYPGESDYTFIDIQSPRTVVARLTSLLRYRERATANGPCLDEERIVVMEFHRGVACEAGYSQQSDTSGGGSLSPYRYCRNDTTGKIKYYATEIDPDDSLPGGCSELTRVGNPCDVATGAKIEKVVDYPGPGPELYRTYRSSSFSTSGRDAEGHIGFTWRHNYERRLFRDENNTWYALRWADGRVVPLVAVGSERYEAADNSGFLLRKQAQVPPGSPFTLNYKWTLFLPDGSREDYQYWSCSPQPYCADGWLLKDLYSPDGHKTTINYQYFDRVGSVVDAFGRALTFSWVDGPGGCFGGCLPRIDFVDDPGGRRIDYAYTANPAGWGTRLYGVLYAGGEWQTYSYDDTPSSQSGRLTGITDGDGTEYASFDYHGDGRVMSSEHAGGVGRVELEYLAGTNPRTVVTDAGGNDTTYEFWDNNSGTRRPAKIIHADGSSLEQSVSSSGRVTDRYVVTPGNETRYHVRNDFSPTFPYRLMSQTEAFGTAEARTTRFEYLDDFSSLLRVVKRPSTIAGKERWSEIEYCPAAGAAPECPPGWPTLPWRYTESTRSVALPNTVDSSQPVAVTTLTYNSSGHVVSIDGPRTDVADVTTIKWWGEQGGSACTTGGGCGQIEWILDPVGRRTTFLYQTDGLVETMTQIGRYTRVFGRDARGRVTSIEDIPVSGPGRFTYLDYDGAGQLEKLTLPSGAILNLFWTPAHQLDYVTDNVGAKLDFGYDSRGNLTDQVWKDPQGNLRRSLAQAYDLRGHPDWSKEGNRPQLDLVSDEVGQLSRTVDALARTTQFGYDDLRRLTSVVGPPGAGSTIYGYNAFGAHDFPESVQAPNGATTLYTYDDAGRPLREVSPDRGTTWYGYDPAGNLACRADGRTTGGATCDTRSGRWVYTNDPAGRTTAIDYTNTPASPDVTMGYDTEPGLPSRPGELRKITNSTGSATVTRRYDYDPWGNVTWSEQKVEEQGRPDRIHATSYQYDGNDQLMQITYPSGRVVDYTRHSNGRLKTVKSTLNGVQTTLVSLATYQPFGPVYSLGYGNGVVQFRERDAAGSPSVTQLADAVSLEGLDLQVYAVNGVGNITQIADDYDPARTRNYDYDNANRLVWDSGVSASNPSYTYDLNGNRLTRTAGTYAAQSFSYLPQSNLEASSSYDGMGNLLDWYATYEDGSGRLASAYDLGTGDTLRFVYNGLGELARTTRTHPDACTNAEILLAIDDYTFTPDGRALAIRTGNVSYYWTHYVWLDDLPVAQIVDSYDGQGNYLTTTVTYLHADHLGTPRIGTNASRQIAWRFRSDAFGIPELSGTAVVRLRFPGQVSLGVGGLNYNYYRTYQPQTGRYLESDPMGLLGGLNSYAYVNNNPLSIIDPTGEGPRLSLACEIGALGYAAIRTIKVMRDASSEEQLDLERQLQAAQRELDSCPLTDPRFSELQKKRDDLRRQVLASAENVVEDNLDLFGLTDVVADLAIQSGFCGLLFFVPGW